MLQDNKNLIHTSPRFTFIDLFAGIGGFHIAMESLGGKCVFASEKDIHARKTYEHNFRETAPYLFENNLFNDDIRKITPSDIPDFDVLCAGFPCQPFSQAGQKRGFQDTHKSERGNLFFNIAEIIDIKKPKAYFLENVQGLVKHNNGNTFRVIQNILKNELGYSFHYKIVKASDYGLPQLRPRVFMIGFKNEDALSNFSFPPPVPLRFTMSDVWGGKCSREIGFTLRVGGRGSNINDRRNWDAYLVDDAVKKIMPPQALKMQGFPDSYTLPVSPTQAMILLGNSVAIDAIKFCGKALIEHLFYLNTKIVDMSNKKNKGEWTEIYTFLALLHDKKLYLADKDLHKKSLDNFFTVSKVTTLNIEHECYLNNSNFINIVDKTTQCSRNIDISNILNKNKLSDILNLIKDGSKTFLIPKIDDIENTLGIILKKGGNSNQKSDIILNIEKDNIKCTNEGFGIKSYLGSKPTLLNASGNTNFIFEICGFDKKNIDCVNNINTKNKITDRISKIHNLGGKFKFSKIEKETMSYNLLMVDSLLPSLIAEMLLEFFINRTSQIKNTLENIANQNIFDFDLLSLTVKVKRFLLSVLLGFFAGERWDGKLISKGIIVVKEDGEQVAYHIIDVNTLEEYLFEHIKFDTPSTTRHRYGSLIIENDGKIYFKLNLQLRF